MAMSETVGSLRAYFILVGVVGVALNALSLKEELNPTIVKVAAVANLAIALAFLASGVLLKKLLRDSPGLLKGLLYASAAVQVVVAAALFAIVQQPVLLLAPAIGLLIFWYLLVNVNRLSAIEKTSKEAV